MSKSKIVVFEGVDGAGKSSTAMQVASRHVNRRLNKPIHSVIIGTLSDTFIFVTTDYSGGCIVTKEESPYAEAIRGIRRLHSSIPPNEFGKIIPILSAAHANFLKDRVAKWVAAGWWVLIDRFYLSSVVYNSKTYPALYFDVDATVIMTATPNTSLSRGKGSDPNESKAALTRNNNKYKGIAHGLTTPPNERSYVENLFFNDVARLVGKVHVVETDRLTPDEVADNVMSFLDTL